MNVRLGRMWLLLWLAVSPPALCASLNVTVVVSNDSAPYAEVAQGIASGLNRDSFGKSRTIGLGALAQLNNSNTDVVVAVGLKAVQALAAMDARPPVLATLIPRTAFEKIANQQKGNQAFSAVYLDQPIARQLEFIRLALPERKRIGVVIGPDSEGLLEPLQKEIRVRGLQLNTVHIRDESELFSALQNVLSESDVLLSFPDLMVFNSRTIQSVLFTAYRYQDPVIGFSPAYVRAGALAAVHSTPAQLAQQVTEILRRFSVRSPTLPPPQHPEYFSVTVNEHVARSLEIHLDSEETLATKLRAPKPRP